MKRILTTALIVAIGLLVNSCNEELFFPEDIRDGLTAPEIHSFSPQSGSIGTEILITGRSLSSVGRLEAGVQAGVYIGGRPTEILRRYTDYSLVLRLVGTELTGPITLVNNIGSVTSAQEFVVIQNIPDVASVTLYGGGALTVLVDDGQTPQRITISGERLNAVRRVTFGEGETLVAGRLIDRESDVLIIEVPYLDVDYNDEVSINLEYMAYGELRSTPIEDILEGFQPLPVRNEFIEPVISNAADIPLLTEPNRVIILRGENLNRIHEVFLSGYQDSTWNIISQTRTELRVLVPNFEGTGHLSFLHNRARVEKSLPELIEVQNPGAWNFTFHRNVILAVNRYQGTGAFNGRENFNNFFDADDGQVFSPCDHEVVDIAEVTTFFFSITAGAIRLQNPANTNTQFQNFNCGGESVLEAGLRGERGTRFRRLSMDNNTERSIIERALLGAEGQPGSFTSLDLDMLINAGGDVINPPTSIYDWAGSGGTTPTVWDVGDVLIFREFLDHTNGGGGVAGRFGFIHIAAVNPGPNYDPANPTAQHPHDRQESHVIVNIWFQRRAE